MHKHNNTPHSFHHVQRNGWLREIKTEKSAQKNVMEQKYEITFGERKKNGCTLDLETQF